MMSSLVIEASEVVLGGGAKLKGPVYVTVKDTLIKSINTKLNGSEVSLRTHLLCPGFIDIHNHGLGGADDVIDYWSNPSYTLRGLPSKGTTSCLATIVVPKETSRIQKVLKVLEGTIGKIENGTAILEGVHAEGPVVNDCGGLPDSDKDISLEDFDSLIKTIPSLKIMTISPHLEASKGYQRIKSLLHKNIRPSLGHDRVATEQDILGALTLTDIPLHVTHIFNVTSFNNRNPSLVNFGLIQNYPNIPQYNDVVPPTVEVIGDLAHVHPLTLNILLQCRSYDSICFITDAVSDGMQKELNYNGRKLVLSDDSKNMVIKGTNTIAGSCVSMLDIFYNLLKKFNIPVENIMTMLAETPAKVANLSHIGTIEVNKRADLILFDSNFNLTHTIVAGNIVWTIN